MAPASHKDRPGEPRSEFARFTSQPPGMAMSFVGVFKSNDTRDQHLNAGAWVVCDAYRAAMRVDEISDDGESETAASVVAIAGIVESSESIEHAEPIGCGNAVTIVIDPEANIRA